MRRIVCGEREGVPVEREVLEREGMKMELKGISEIKWNALR